MQNTTQRSVALWPISQHITSPPTRNNAFLGKCYSFLLELYKLPHGRDCCLLSPTHSTTLSGLTARTHLPVSLRVRCDYVTDVGQRYVSSSHVILQAKAFQCCWLCYRWLQILMVAGSTGWNEPRSPNVEETIMKWEYLFIVWVRCEFLLCSNYYILDLFVSAASITITNLLLKAFLCHSAFIAKDNPVPCKGGCGRAL